MKRLGLIVLLGVLAACGTDEVSEPQEGPEQEEAQEQQSEPVTTEQEEQVIDLEMTDNATYAWVEESTGLGWLSFYGIVENTGNTPIMLEGSSVEFYNTSDEIISTTNTLSITPAIVPPGEKAYVSVYEPLGDSTPEEFQGAKLSPQPSAIEGEPEQVETMNVTLDGSKVTGEFAEAQENVNISSALFDANGELLGILNGGTINGTSFELFDPPFPDESIEAIATQETKAYK